MPAPVAWTYDYTTEPWLRWAIRAGAGALLGLYLAFVASGVVSLSLVLASGDPALIALLVLFALVGGPLSLLYLLPMLTDADQRPGPFTGRERRVPLREWLTAGVVGALAIGGAFLLHPLLSGALFVAGAAVGLVGVLCSTRGRIDTETATLERDQREWDLSRVTGYDTRSVGPLVVVSLDASGPGSFGTVPSRIAVPKREAAAVTAVLDGIVTADTATDHREPNSAVRAVALLFAAGLAAAGVAAVVYLEVLGWWMATMCLLFAGIFLFVAREG
jgi:hypothetical protein